MTVADFTGSEPGSYSAKLDEQARRKGVRPVASIDELRADVFSPMKNSTSSWLI